MKPLLRLLPLLAITACGRGDAPAVSPPPGADSAAAADPPAAAQPVAGAPARAAVPPSPTQAQVDAADSAAARDFRRRAALHETYAGCMRKIAQADAAARAQLEAVCRRLPDAPR